MPHRALGLLLALLAVAAPAAAAKPTVVSLEFDDANADQAIALPLLAAQHLTATFYTPSHWVGTPGHLTWPQLHAMQRAGDEIAGHTLDHVRLTSLSTPRARSEVCADRAVLRARGFAVTDFAYPFGARSPRVQRIVAGCGYRTARAISGLVCPGCPFAEPIPIRDRYATRTPQAVLAGTRPTDLHRLVAGAQAHGGGWIQVVFHHVCDRCNRYSVDRSTLREFLGWLRHRSGVRVLTVAQTSAML